MRKVIEEHSIDVDLLTGGWVIDAGCRGWKFSNAMKELGEKVYALDIEDMYPPEGIIFERKALSHYGGSTTVFLVGDKNGAHTGDVSYVGTRKGSVDCITLQTIKEKLDGEIDVLKLDIEGSEYFLLTENFIPIAKQISIEFHEHCFKSLHDRLFFKCIKSLQEYYHIAYLERMPMHGAGLNYWDSLFIRK